MDKKKPQTARLDKDAVIKFMNSMNDNVDTQKIDSDKLLRQYAMEMPEPVSPEKGLALYLPRRPEPVIITDKNIITMGRNDPVSGINPTLDLTEFHGAELGVSRFHAEISITDGRYYIKDMGSTNGTYVNGKKVPPYKLTHIRNADQIRLGHLSIVIG
ncbi:MAG: FHA domain-containing protein [Anaerolineae bacterium]|nr:FHA domain-containing protein [Anaerolineae bacterium]